jgi:hypothetical protein
MKMSRLAIGVIFLICMTFGQEEIAQSQELANAPIRFITPDVFSCGANIPWSRVLTWSGEEGQCGAGLLYRIVGEVPAVRDGYIKGKIIIPEVNNKEWAPYNGEVQTIINNKFEIQFCITTRNATRPIRLQVYAQNGDKIGDSCTITLVGVQL